MIIKRKKGQSEFFGLIIIVLLLSVGLMYMMTLKKSQLPDTTRSEYIDQSLAQNTINALLNIRTECKPGLYTGIKLSTLIIDCADMKKINCYNGESSCEYVNRTIENLLNLTLNFQNKPYHFFIEPLDETGVEFTNLGCHNSNATSSLRMGTQVFPLSTDVGRINLLICN